MSERENILSVLREKPLKVFEIMRRANVSNEESCQSLLLRMRDEGSVTQRVMVHRVTQQRKRVATKLRCHCLCKVEMSLGGF